jgi:DNA-binding MarR family transcriptional regulator
VNKYLIKEESMKFSESMATYLRFIRASSSLEGEIGFTKLESVEGRLLDCLAIREMEGKPSLVLDAILLRNIGSQATLHRRLMRLCASGYLRYSCDTDGRKKYLELTPKARDYYSKLGECIIKSTKNLINAGRIDIKIQRR